MSIPINEEDPIRQVHSAMRISPCVTACGGCDACIRYMRSGVLAEPVTVSLATQPTIKSRAEFYQIALREEGEAKEALRKVQAELVKAQEALNDATAQLILTRDGLFKACGL